ncbi:MAG: phosphoglycerate mutase [Burkholderiaceae bacterium]
MSDNNHLLILGAAPPGLADSGEHLLLRNTAPHLAQLLEGMAPGEVVELPADSPSMPWEVALARLRGLPAEPGHIPWAAFDTETTGIPCAWVRPCFWRVGVDHVMPMDPEALDLDEGTSRAFLSAMSPYFAEDGIALAYRSPTRWLATGELFRGLASVSLERVVGRRITPSDFGGPGPGGALLRRLQNEMQMLLYTHAANDTRQDNGRLPVNSFWVAGAGELASLPGAGPGVVVDASLRASALAGDAPAHALAWRALDGGAVAALAGRQAAGEPVHITLCGERFARTFHTSPPSLAQRLRGLFRGGMRHENVLETL